MGHVIQFSCRCEQAVVTAYSELRHHGTDDMSAFVACTTLYRIHHPEASLGEARRLVAEWVDHHLDRATGHARLEA
jgi:streptomycin 6-kinase